MIKFRNFSLALFLFLLSATIVFAQDTGSIKGKVRSLENGKALAGAQITIRQNGKDLKTAQTDSDGEFKISGLAVGRYNLVVEKDGFSPGVLYNVEVRSNKTNNLKDRLGLNIDEGSLVLVEASVFNQNGFSIYGAKVIIEEVLENGETKKVGSGLSSQDGDVLFRFEEKAAKYRITASVKDIEASKEVEVSGAAIYRTAITLKLPVKKK